MANPSFKQALGKFFKENPESASKLKSFGFSEEEAAKFKSGNFEGFSDKQLFDRFNPKVLGAFGIDPNSFSFSKDGQFFFKEGFSSFKKKGF